MESTWAKVLFVLVIFSFTFLFGEGQSSSNVVQQSEQDSRDLFTGGLRELKRRRRRKKVDRFGVQSGYEELCDAIFQKGVASSLSTCQNTAIQTQNLINPSSSCDGLRRNACKETNGCMFGEITKKCHADPCYRINNGRCTIQHTGGRCVWYTKAQNKRVNGRNSAGCYQSPCQGVLTPKSCRKAGNEVYKCVWCGRSPIDGTRFGCVNEKSESSAQCYNIGAGPDFKGCSDCIGQLSRNAKCPSQECRDNCCGSIFCSANCILEDDRETDSGLNIITGNHLNNNPAGDDGQ